MWWLKEEVPKGFIEKHNTQPVIGWNQYLYGEWGITAQCKHAKEVLENEDKDVFDEQEKRAENKCVKFKDKLMEKTGKKQMEGRSC